MVAAEVMELLSDLLPMNTLPTTKVSLVRQ